MAHLSNAKNVLNRESLEHLLMGPERLIEPNPAFEGRATIKYSHIIPIHYEVSNVIHFQATRFKNLRFVDVEAEGSSSSKFLAVSFSLSAALLLKFSLAG